MTLDPQQLRRDFPIFDQLLPDGRTLVYLDNAASTQRPREVIAAMVEIDERYYANVHRGIHWLSEQATDRYEAARNSVQAFLGAAEPEEIIFTRGTTESINLVARAWGDEFCRAGDEIVLTEMEHHANLVPWQQLASRTGVVLRHIPITDDGQLDLAAAEELIGPRTRMVAVAHASNVLGTINPVSRLGEMAHAAGALLMVDAAQSVPHLRIDVQSLGADFLAFSGHKAVGPSAVGVLYGRRDLLERMPPFLGGGGMIRRVRLDGFESAELPAKFEAGTPPIVPAIGLKTAIDYLERVGLDAIHAHEQQLASRAHQLLGALEGVRLLGPEPMLKTGIVSFVVDRVHAHDVAQLLDRSGIAVRAGHHCTMPLHKRLGIGASARASFYLYNTLEEVDLLAESLAAAQQLFRRRKTER